jgi:hypothetical protein
VGQHDALREGLTEVQDAPIPTWASAGLSERAGPIAARSARALAFLGELLGVVPDVQLLVLTEGDWAGRSGHPVYGMPNSLRDTLVVAGEANQFWLAFVDMLDPEPQLELRAAYRGADDEIDLAPFFDLLAVHELAHTFEVAGGVRFPRLWLREFFCNVCLHAYVAAAEPEAMAALTAFPRLVAQVPGDRLSYRTIADFERIYDDMPGPNYGWFQCRLHVAAGRLVESAGPQSVRKLFDAYRVDDAELSALLGTRVHPELRAIAEELA